LWYNDFEKQYEDYSISAEFVFLLMSSGNFMKFFLFCILIICACSSASLAQGFNWHYSWRLPSAGPRFFAGAELSLLHSAEHGDFASYHPDIRCGRYADGSGTGWRAGLCSEYWIQGSTAITIALRYSHYSTLFTGTVEEPIKLDGIPRRLIREFGLDIQRNELALFGGIKRRLPGSHFSIGAGAEFSVLLGRSARQKETILEPVEYTQSVEYGDPPLPEAPAIGILPCLRIGWDAEMGRGIYATPHLQIGYSLLSRALQPGGTWSAIQINAGISIMGAIFP
jgi:hypothetical protein